MSAGPIAATTPRTLPFTLTIGGRLMNAYLVLPLPDDDGMAQPCVISEAAAGSPNQMTFTLEDTSGTLDFDFGEVTELIDNRVTNGRKLFGGHLVEIESTPLLSNQGRMLACTAIGYDAWLDWRVIPSWSSKTNKGGRVTKIDSDRAMVQQLINRYAGFLEAPNSTVASTNTSMDVVSLRKATLREALQRVGETAMSDDTESNRNFYVDNDRRLHYYRGSESLAAPYRVGDGSYVRTVATTAGLVSYWTLRESSGSTAYDAMGVVNGTLTGGYTQNVTSVGVVNEPQYRALTLNGTTGYVTASNASLHPGDTFTIAFWVKRGATGSVQTVWSGGSGDVEVGFDASDKLVVYKEGTGNHFVSDTAYTSTSAWYHVVVARSPGATSVYVNGDAITGTTTARTFAAAAGAINIGRRVSLTDRYLTGTVQHVAVSSTKWSAATALAHYNQGITLTPDDWRYTRSAYEGREAVYVSGSNADGTGWVRNPSIIGTAFGAPNRQPERQEIIDRDDSEGAGKKRSYGRWFLQANDDPIRFGSFSITGFDGWRVGQLVSLTSTADGLSGYQAEIKSIDTDVLFGSGVLKYTIHWGRAKWSGARAIARGKRRGR